MEILETVEHAYALGQKSARAAYSTQVIRLLNENRNNPAQVDVLLDLLLKSDRESWGQVVGLFRETAK